MKIVIPTYQRSDRQPTLEAIPDDVKTYLAVRPDEAAAYVKWTFNRNCDLLVLPPSVQGIDTTRDYIVRTCEETKLVMLDDDLSFAVRRMDDKTKFFPATAASIHDMLGEISSQLNYSVHVGVSAREGANRNTDEFMYSTRMMRVLGYSVDVLKAYGLKFAPYTVMCDFAMTLQLLTLGHKNCIINEFVHNQAGSNTAGGCSVWRNPERQAEAAETLHAAFPDFVKIVQKHTKSSWNGQPRTDVVIRWKKALGNRA